MSQPAYPPESTNKPAQLKFPNYQWIGQARMSDSREVTIMSPQQWDEYVWNYNHLNGVVQQPDLVERMNTYAGIRQRNANEFRANQEEFFYNKSW